jgi:V8-like Glu-specific endopeptidase
MKNLLFAAVLMLVTFHTKAITNGREVKGYDPITYKTPYAGELCTVTFISPTVALTAAHCLSSISRDDLFLSGESNGRQEDRS